MRFVSNLFNPVDPSPRRRLCADSRGPSPLEPIPCIVAEFLKHHQRELPVRVLLDDVGVLDSIFERLKAQERQREGTSSDCPFRQAYNSTISSGIWYFPAFQFMIRCISTEGQPSL